MKSSFDNQESPAKRAPTPEEMKEIAATLRECRFPMYAEIVEAAADALAEREWRATHRHYKGGLYKFVSHARHSENDEVFVVYEDAQKCRWARPAKMFNETLPDGRRRFEPLPSPPPAKEGEKT